MLILVIFLVIILLCLFLYFKFFKVPKTDCVSFVNGGVKTGKSTLSIYLTYKDYKRKLRKWKFRKYILRKKSEPKPVIYSNIPLTCDYIPVTNSMLKREVNLVDNCSMYLGEFSLIADNKIYKNSLLSEQLQLFIKLFGHQTHGKGKLFIDSQAIGDLPIEIRRCLSRYIYIERSIKWIPFFIILKTREMYYSEDGSIQNVSTQDVEEDCYKRIIVSKRIWKKFDYCCYSSFTDNLVVSSDVVQNENYLKARCIPSFNNYKTIPTSEKLNEKKEVLADEKK